MQERQNGRTLTTSPIGAHLFRLALPMVVGILAMMWFNPDPLVVQNCMLYFLVVGLTLGFRTVYLAGSAGLNALNHAVAATVLTAVQGLGIAIPVAWWAGRAWGLTGIFGGLSLSNFVVGIATSLYLRRILKRILGETSTGGS